MGNTINYYVNPATPPDHINPLQASDTNALLTQPQNNINVTPLLIGSKSEMCSAIHESDTAIELCLGTKLNDYDVQYINSQGRKHIDSHYVGMLKSKPIQKNKARPSRRRN